jgi:hypothetical protein
MLFVCPVRYGPFLTKIGWVKAIILVIPNRSPYANNVANYFALSVPHNPRSTVFFEI